MTLIAEIVAALLLLYFALRVVQIKRATMPFLIAYPLFVLILIGGGIAVFVGISWVVVLAGLSKEAALAVTYGGTLMCLGFLWWAARRAIG